MKLFAYCKLNIKSSWRRSRPRLAWQRSVYNLLVTTPCPCSGLLLRNSDALSSLLQAEVAFVRPCQAPASAHTGGSEFVLQQLLGDTSVFDRPLQDRIGAVMKSLADHERAKWLPSAGCFAVACASAPGSAIANRRGVDVDSEPWVFGVDYTLPSDRPLNKVWYCDARAMYLVTAVLLLIEIFETVDMLRMPRISVVRGQLEVLCLCFVSRASQTKAPCHWCI